jgi:hypothetical protein
MLTKTSLQIVNNKLWNSAVFINNPFFKKQWLVRGEQRVI